MDPIGQLCETIGEAKLRSMVAAFYRRVREDDLIGRLYPPEDWEGAEKRLADFIVYRFGGPPVYLQERGHPMLRARHMPFPIGGAERDRWMALMMQAMDEVEIPADTSPVVNSFFA